MGGNSLTSGLRGPCKLEFKDGTVIRFNAPDFKLSGTVMGERTIECVGSLVFQDLTNNIKAVVQLGTFKETGFWTKTQSGSKTGIEGIIYKVRASDNELIKFGKNQDLPTDINKLKDISSKICDVSGGWLEKIVFGAKQYWNIDRDLPER